MCCKNVIDFYLFIYSKLSSNTFAGCYYSTKLSTVTSFFKNPRHFTGTNY